MKEHIIKLLRNLVLQIIAFSLLIGMITFAAISWPTIQPTGSTSGGTFMGYFNKIFSKNCKSIKDFRSTLGLSSSSGNYTIYPDSINGLSVYCDMTTDGGGWTRYVKIKGNYSYNDAYGCLQGKLISNSNLECFSPVYSRPTQLLTRYSGTDYINDIPVNTMGVTGTGGIQVRTTWDGRGYFDGMTSSNTEGTTKGNYIRLGLHYSYESNSSREYGGIYADSSDLSTYLYMKYSTSGRTGTCSSCDREGPTGLAGYPIGNALSGEIYFR